MSIDINNKTVLITGANRGIGKVILERALEQGAAKVYAAVRTLESAQPLVAEYGNRVVPIRVDLEDPDSIKEAASTASDVEIVGERRDGQPLEWKSSKSWSGNHQRG